jgi:hypothetical protein
MVDLFQLAIPQRLLIFRLREIGIVLYLEVKDMAAVRSGGAEGGDDECGLEVLLGGEELDGEVFLGL